MEEKESCFTAVEGRTVYEVAEQLTNLSKFYYVKVHAFTKSWDIEPETGFGYNPEEGTLTIRLRPEYIALVELKPKEGEGSYESLKVLDNE